MTLDLFFFDLVHNFANRSGILDALGIFLAHYLPWILSFLAIIIFFRVRSWRYRFYFASLTLLSVIFSRGIITESIRLFYSRPRPFMALGFEPLISYDTSGSFPSGHATAYFALALAVYFFARRYPQFLNLRWGSWFLVGAILMGIARIFVGVHWPADILGGALIGIGSTYLVWRVLPKPESETKSEARSTKFETNP